MSNSTSLGSGSGSGSGSGVIDISDMLTRCGFDATSLLSLSVCPALSTYREMAGITESTAGAFDSSDYNTYFPNTSLTNTSLANKVLGDDMTNVTPGDRKSVV